MPSHPNLQRCDLDIEDGLLEVGRIFAEGVLRLRRSGHFSFGPNGLSIQTALKTARQDLEQSRISRLSVSRG